MKCFEFIKAKLSDESIPLTERLLTIILNCVILGTMVGFIPMLFGNTEGWWLNILMMILSMIAQIMNIVFKKSDLATLFLSLTGVLIVIPLMYFFQGGFNSGIPFWLVFGVSMAFIMNQGWRRYCTVILALIMFSACIIIEYYYPDSVSRLPNRKSIFFDILVSFISTTAIFLIMLDIYLKAYKKKRESLNYALHNDALTGIENRYSYEKYFKYLNKKPFSYNLVFISGDVNGLKKINDTKGHVAGDELLIGAAQVFSQTFSKYGRVFRTGGDEFQAILETDVTPDELRQDFENNMNNWRGSLVSELHISIGFARSKAADLLSYTDLSKAADNAMYKDKADYYNKIGINRRNR